MHMCPGLLRGNTKRPIAKEKKATASKWDGRRSIPQTHTVWKTTPSSSTLAAGGSISAMGLVESGKCQTLPKKKRDGDKSTGDAEVKRNSSAYSDKSRAFSSRRVQSART